MLASQEEVQPRIGDRRCEVTRQSGCGLRGVRVGEASNPGTQSTRIDTMRIRFSQARSVRGHGDSAESVPIPGAPPDVVIDMTVADTDDESAVQEQDGFVSVVSQRSRRHGGLFSAAVHTRGGEHGRLRSSAPAGAAVLQGGIPYAGASGDKGEKVCTVSMRRMARVDGGGGRGRSGVEVWLVEGLGVNARDVTIAIENHRCLAISVPLLSRRFYLSLRTGLQRTLVRNRFGFGGVPLQRSVPRRGASMLLDANASFNEDAGIHCGGSGASKENTAGTALKELVAERALCIPQTFGNFGPTRRTRRLDFVEVPLPWHAAVSDIKLQPPETLAFNDFFRRSVLTRISWQQTPATPGHDAERQQPWVRTASLRSTCGRLARGTFELSRGWLGARSRMGHRADGARAPWSQCPRSSGSR